MGGREQRREGGREGRREGGREGGSLCDPLEGDSCGSEGHLRLLLPAASELHCQQHMALSLAPQDVRVKAGARGKRKKREEREERGGVSREGRGGGGGEE